MKAENLLTVGLVGVGLYAAYKLLSAGSKVVSTAAGAVGQAFTSTQDALASGLYSLFGPTENFGSTTYYTVTFPDGSRHAVGADLVDGSGQFTWTGYPAGSQPPQQLQIVVDASGNKFATAIPS